MKRVEIDDEDDAYGAIIREAERRLGPNQEPSPGRHQSQDEEKLIPQKPVEQRLTFAKVTELCLQKHDREESDVDKVAESLLKVKVARLDWQGFTAIENLDALTSIEDLYLQHNQIRRIDNLNFHHRLKFLALGNNMIEKVENLKHLENLELLDLSNNLIRDFCVDELPVSLRNVDFSGNKCAAKQGYHAKLLCGKLPRLVIIDDLPVHDMDDEENKNGEEKPADAEELITTSRAIRKQEGRPSSALGRSDAMMEAAMLRIEEMTKSTRLGTRKSFVSHRQAFAERSKSRMAEQDAVFREKMQQLQQRPEKK